VAMTELAHHRYKEWYDDRLRKEGDDPKEKDYVEDDKDQDKGKGKGKGKDRDEDENQAVD